MQTILLLSHGKFLNNDLSKILGRSLFGLKVTHITTAVKGAQSDMTSFLEVVNSAFNAYGCLVEDLDIEGKNYEELKTILGKADIVFVNSGNSFYLLKAIRESGFDKVIKELLPKGLIYMGASAGAYVACPTIEMATWKSNKNRVGLTDLTAMNLVSFLLSAHYIPEYHDLLKENSAKAKYETWILTDEQAILIKDNKTNFLGGEEIKL